MLPESFSKLAEAMPGIVSVASSPDGKLLATGDTDGKVRVWQINSVSSTDRLPLRKAFRNQADPLSLLLTLEGHSVQVWTISFSPDSRTLASGSHDASIRLWDVSSGRCCNILQGHTSDVRSVAFSPNGQMLASGSEDSFIRIWDVQTGKCLKVLQGHASWVFSVAFSPDGQTLASGSLDTSVQLWDVHIGVCLRILRGHTGGVRSLAFQPHSTSVVLPSTYVLASGSQDASIRLWDVQAGACLGILEGHTDGIYSVCFSSDGWTLDGAVSGGILASGSQDASIRLWEMHKGQCFSLLQENKSAVRSISYTQPGLLVSGNQDGTAKVWDVDNGECVYTLKAVSKDSTAEKVC